MNGSSSTPTKAVNSSSTATLLCLKNRSTRYLSKCTETAHRTGPENAKTTQDNHPPQCLLRKRFGLRTRSYSQSAAAARPYDALVTPCGRHNFAFVINRLAAVAAVPWLHFNGKPGVTIFCVESKFCAESWWRTARAKRRRSRGRNCHAEKISRRMLCCQRARCGAMRRRGRLVGRAALQGAAAGSD